MPTKINLFFFTLLLSCSSVRPPSLAPAAPKEFSRGEIILGAQLLTKIFDQEMASLGCVPDTDEASLLLRTIAPRMELIQDDLEAMLDNPAEVKSLIDTCDQNCTCSFIDDLFREHLLVLSKDNRKLLDQKKKKKDLNTCLTYAQTTFCQSELFKTLDIEKADFSYDE